MQAAEKNLTCYLLNKYLSMFDVIITSDVVRDEGVYVLTQENFDEFLANNDYVLVEFYGSWCVHCRIFAREYARAAKILANEGSPIVLAKVDCTVETSLAKKYGIKSFLEPVCCKKRQKIVPDQLLV